VDIQGDAIVFLLTNPVLDSMLNLPGSNIEVQLTESTQMLMKKSNRCFAGLFGAVACLAMAGCAEVHPNYTTSPYHPGPVAGQSVGVAAGVVAGNAAGAVVGLGEGAVKGAAAPFDTTTHVVRRWHTETTPDGRTIQVPQDILVDQYGRPVNPPPNPPAATPASTPLTSPKDQ